MNNDLLLHPIEFDDLVLKQLTEVDAEQLFALSDLNRNYLREWLSWVDKTPTIKEASKFIKSSLEGARNNTSADFGIYFKGKLVGVIGFHAMNLDNKKTTIGYWLDRDHQGRGIMTKSVKILIQFAFEKLDINRIQINCGVGNLKSCAIPQRLGFTKEGIARQAEWVNDHFVDWEQYSLLKDEFDSH